MATAMTIVCVEEGARFAVHSASGHQYNIRYAGSGDADPEYVALWDCDCPAALHGTSCKHLVAFLASRLTEDNIKEGDSVEIDAAGNFHWHPAPEPQVVAKQELPEIAPVSDETELCYVDILPESLYGFAKEIGDTAGEVAEIDLHDLDDSPTNLGYPHGALHLHRELHIAPRRGHSEAQAYCRIAIMGDKLLLPHTGEGEYADAWIERVADAWNQR